MPAEQYCLEGNNAKTRMACAPATVWDMRSQHLRDGVADRELRRRSRLPSAEVSAAEETNCSVWIVVAVLAVGTVASGLLRIRAWLQKPAPPEVIEAAHRHDDEDD